jgi:glutaconate CoA-transferase subunit B
MTSPRPQERLLASMMRALPESGIVLFGADSVFPMIAIFAARQWGKNLTIVSAVNTIDPRPDFLPYSTMDPHAGHRGSYVIPMAEAYDLIGRGEVDHIFVSAAQIDAHGALNSSVIRMDDGPDKRLPGGGGLAMILRTVSMVDAWKPAHLRRTFPARVDFVTGVGNLRHVITPMAIMTMEEEELRVASIRSGDTLDKVQDATEFTLQLTTKESGLSRVIAEPTAEEIDCIERVDPRGVRYATEVY